MQHDLTPHDAAAVAAALNTVYRYDCPTGDPHTGLAHACLLDELEAAQAELRASPDDRALREYVVGLWHDVAEILTGLQANAASRAIFEGEDNARDIASAPVPWIDPRATIEAASGYEEPWLGYIRFPLGCAERAGAQVAAEAPAIPASAVAV
ncbi:hypothetical protein [Oricola indica]|uniref:hypothetical protein n=1 Tax=Oricola indica TaxID=2872591 RepID=UPI001CBC8DA8|nr:hypothetical protein [Oricola indica]